MIILEAKVRLLPNPPARSLLVLGYPDVYQAGDHVPDIMQFEPIALEGMDDRLIEAARADLEQLRMAIPQSAPRRGPRNPTELRAHVMRERAEHGV